MSAPPAAAAKGIRAGSLLVASISSALHALAFLRFTMNQGAYGLPAEWTRDYDLLLLVSLALVPVIHIFSSARVRITVVVIRIVVFVVLGLPFGGFLDIRYMLMFALLLDLNTCFAFPGSAALSAVVMACTAVFLAPLSAFSRTMPAPGSWTGPPFSQSAPRSPVSSSSFAAPPTGWTTRGGRPSP